VHTPCLCSRLCIKNLGGAVATGGKIFSVCRELYAAHDAVTTRADVSVNEEYERGLFNIPFMMKRVYKVDIQYTFDLGIEDGKPVTTFSF
jgi:hypothetical protein